MATCKKSGSASQEYKDKDTLRELYLSKGLTIKQIAERLDCSTWAVKKYLKKFNSRRNQIQDLALHEGLLRELYLEKRLSPRSIADRLKLASRGKVIDRLGEFGIQRRGRVESHKIEMRRKPASYSMTSHGYERWTNKTDGEISSVYVHRLLAVSEYGFDAVADSEVHHKDEIPWDNRPNNIEVTSTEEHRGVHLVWGKGITPDVCNEIRDKYSGGVGATELSEEYDICRRSIYHHANNNCQCDKNSDTADQ